MTFKAIKYRAHNAYDTEQASDEAAIKTVGPSMTVQSMAEDADINVLMHRYGITGKFPDNPQVPTYDDFSQVTDFRTALEAVGRAEEQFLQFPAQLRARFQNNPQILMEFLDDPRNRSEGEALGLIKRPPEGPSTGGPSQPAPGPVAPQEGANRGPGEGKTAEGVPGLPGKTAAS